MKLKYEFAQGCAFGGKTRAQAVGKMLDELRKQLPGKDLTPEVVVEHAKPASSVLHGYFTWNNLKAAKKFRLDEARYLLRSLKVRIRLPNGKWTMATHAFVTLRQPGSREPKNYQAIVEVLSNAKQRQILLTMALKELEAWSQRYSNFSEFAAIFSAIKKATKKIKQ